MKKSQTQISEPRKREVLDSSRRQYRCVVEAARQLEEKQSQIQNCLELFQPDLVARRARLIELCERLALSQPAIYGKKAEEILWRKAHYEVLSIAKRFKKNGKWNDAEKAVVEKHLLSGVGCYQLLVLRLQSEYQLDLRGLFDMPLPLGEGCLSYSTTATKTKDQIGKDWAQQAVHRSLISLGDLTRYLADLTPVWNQNQAARFYLQALSVDPCAGMPHNQLGMLAGSQNNHLDAIFHYMRCLGSADKFEGAEGNLKRALQRSTAILVRQPDSGRAAAPASPAEQVKQCVAKFLSLAYTWYFDHELEHNHGQLCEEALMDLELCLTLPVKGIIKDSTENVQEIGSNFLDDNLLFKLVAITLLCVSSLQNKGSPQVSAASTFALALLSRLASQAVNVAKAEVGTNGHPAPEVSNGGHKPNKKKKRHIKMRRRGGDSSEESDQSEVESGSESSSDGSTDSEDNESSSGDEEEREQQTKNKSEESTTKSLTSGQGLLMSTKLLFDWLRGDLSVLHACAQMGLLPHVIQLINLTVNGTVASDTCRSGVLGVAELVPLPEDVAMRGVSVLTEAQTSLDWDFPRRNRLHRREEVLLRSYKLVSFGHFIAAADEGVTFDPESGLFAVGSPPSFKKTASPPKNNGPAKNGATNGNNRSANEDDNVESKSQMMRHMGRLWLRAEVRELERAVRKREGACTFSPYIVVDTDALLNHTSLVKQLVFSRKFVVIIPCVVVGALDELKRETSRARDVTRWLETQFQRGNRFLRAQRTAERMSLPLIKYPKKKDKEAWIFFQVLECCAHLAQQAASGAGASQPAGSALVTLLTGSDLISSKEFSPSGLAQTAGINLESVTSFCSKWKVSAKKSHG